MEVVRQKFLRLYADAEVAYDLPDNLTDLDGPATGTIALPSHLDPHGLGPFDLSDPRDADTVYKLVLNDANTTDDLHHLNHTVLVDIWPRLTLPNLLRETWEDRFPQLTGTPGVDTLRGPMHGLGRQYILADTRDNLDGPTTGTITLPNQLDWSGGTHTYDLDTSARVKSLYITVLREASSHEDLGYLNWDILVDIWPELRIPTRVRDMWEAKFPELTGNTVMDLR